MGLARGCRHLPRGERRRTYSTHQEKGHRGKLRPRTRKCGQGNARKESKRERVLVKIQQEGEPIWVQTTGTEHWGSSTDLEY